MKAIAGYLIGSVVLVVVAAIFFRSGLLDRQIADAQKRAVDSDFSALENALNAAEPYYEYASRVPFVGTRPLNELRAKKAALNYWQRRYGPLLNNQEDPLASVPADNIELQFLTASGLYRQGIARTKDQESTLATLDAGIGAYLTVLKNATRHEDAAYNYEYLLKLRNEVDKGRRKVIAPDEASNPQGTSGAPQAEQESTKDFKVYIPLESQERKTTEGEAGKAAPLKRKG
jgi:hypothetical protein